MELFVNVCEHVLILLIGLLTIKKSYHLLMSLFILVN